MIVSNPARPGATILGPPLNPAKKWGSTKPIVILKSDLIQSLFINTGIPFFVVPTLLKFASSNAS